MEQASLWSEIEVVPLVKAYPATRSDGSEAVCVAGIELRFMEQPRWVRLFPVPFRSLTGTQQFRKWEPIKVKVRSHSGDRRPETKRPDIDSIATSGGVIKPKDRTAMLDQLPETTTCRLMAQQKDGGATLGWIRPKVADFEIELRPEEDVAQAQARADAGAAQETLFGDQRAALEAIPYVFRYRYTCAEGGCPGHFQSNIDWELHQTFRRWRRDYPDDHLDRIKAKWLGEMCADDKDTRFYLGNMHQHPGSFLVLGVSWIKRG